jgi:hypothetical protein
MVSKGVTAADADLIGISYNAGPNASGTAPIRVTTDV